jgi:hypothetical protein
MKLHSNATTCQHSRELLVRRVLDQRWTRAAEAAGVRVRTVSRRDTLLHLERRRGSRTGPDARAGAALLGVRGTIYGKHYETLALADGVSST